MLNLRFLKEKFIDHELQVFFCKEKIYSDKKVLMQS